MIYMPICMWICACMCVYVCIRVFMCVCLCVFMCIYMSVYTLVGILPAYSDSYVDFLNDPHKFFKRRELMYANYGNLYQHNEMGCYVCIAILRLLGSSNCGHRSWPVNVNVRNPIKRDTMAPKHCLKNIIFYPEIFGFLDRLETEWTMISS